MVNLHVLVLKIEQYSKCWVFADPVMYYVNAAEYKIVILRAKITTVHYLYC